MPLIILVAGAARLWLVALAVGTYALHVVHSGDPID
jgi:hypothetical protein